MTKHSIYIIVPFVIACGARSDLTHDLGASEDAGGLDREVIDGGIEQPDLPERLCTPDPVVEDDLYIDGRDFLFDQVLVTVSGNPGLGCPLAIGLSFISGARRDSLDLTIEYPPGAETLGPITLITTGVLDIDGVRTFEEVSVTIESASNPYTQCELGRCEDTLIVGRVDALRDLFAGSVQFSVSYCQFFEWCEF